MQLEYVAGKAQQRPFYGCFHRSTQQKPSEVHVLLRHGKYALCLCQEVQALYPDYQIYIVPDADLAD